MISGADDLPAIVGIGAGGHCKVLLEIIRLLGTWKIEGLLDTDPSMIGSSVSGYNILGTDEMTQALYQKGIRTAFIGIGSVGSSQLRRKLVSRLLDIGFELPPLIHPKTSVALDTSIGHGTSIMPGVIVNPGAVIGEHCILNSGAIVEHDCKISDYAHISPGAMLGGAVQVGEGSHVGIGAVVKQGIRIGTNAIIGAGAVVIKDVPDGLTVMGVPASARQ